MELQYVKSGQYKDFRGIQTCQYNDACQCDRYHRKECYRCGWNPKVAKRRAEKLLVKGSLV